MADELFVPIQARSGAGRKKGESTSGPWRKEAAMGSPQTRLRRSLVIEDQRSDRDLIVKILTREGFRVDSVADGHEGLEKIFGAIANTSS
jgi:hypothetical protein